ncbi:MAG: hypothetical protein F6J95_025525 [Leptolyngbya sp. SIO1E4]|nr:hypothetical protein [Leptolyngbya sp. SIO1E4]
MKHDSKPQSIDVNIRRWVLISAFRLSMVWDLLTTFLGSLIILGSASFIALGLSLVGTLTVGAFNFSTKSIWKRRRVKRVEIALLQLTWIFAIAFDFWTSLTCNTTYIALQQFNLGQSGTLSRLFSQLTVGQVLIVLFVTTLTTISPMMVGAIRDRTLDFLT